MKTITKTIGIKRRLDLSNDYQNIRSFIFKNINYCRFVKNKFVEASRGEGKAIYFDPWDFKVKFFNEFEKPNKKYHTYCRGISESIANEYKKTQKTIKTLGFTSSKFRYVKFNKFYGSFKVHLKPSIIKRPHTPNHLNSSLYILDDLNLEFSPGLQHKNFILTLKEPLFSDTVYAGNTYPYYIDKNKQYYFRNEDIKEIAFVHELGKFYIVLSVKVTYIVSDLLDVRSTCGIDLGIKNPITWYSEDDNGNEICGTIRFPKRVYNRIKYLDRICQRLNKILDRKYNKELKIQSNNYYKVLKKLRITYRKITNIRMNWIKKTVHELAMQYNKICIDKYECPTTKSLQKEGMKSNIAIRRINYAARMHGLSYFYEFLNHSLEKTGGKMIESPDYTTVTCSHCGYINIHLPVNRRLLICSKCGAKIDRDINAAKNCFYAVC